MTTKTQDRQKLHFEFVATSSDEDTIPNLHRARVPGGWLVLAQRSKSLVYVPDRKHDWNPNPLVDSD